MQNFNKEFNIINIIKFVSPTVLMMLIIASYTLIDSLFISNFVGTKALSAVNIAFPIINLLMAIGLMFASGGCAVVSFMLGQGKKDKACETMSMFYIVNIFVALIYIILIYIFIDPIIHLAGGTNITYDYVKDYLCIYLLFFIFVVTNMMNQSFLVASGNPKTGTKVSIIALICNVIFDYLFIVVLDLGIIGAALGTGLAISVGVLIGLHKLFNNNILTFNKPKFNIRLIGKGMLNGASELITNVSIGITTIVFNLTMLVYIDEYGIAAISIALYLQFFFNSIFIGYAIGIAPLISFNYGSQNINNLKILFKNSIKILIVCQLCVFLFSSLFSDVLILLFVDKTDIVYSIIRKGIILFNISYLMSGINIFSSCLFTALNNGKVSGFISIMRTCILLVSSIIILPMLIGIPGIWIAVSVGECLSIFISIYLMYRYRNIYSYY